MRKFFRAHTLLVIFTFIVFASLLFRWFTLGVKVEFIRSYLASFGILAPLLYIFLFSVGLVVPVIGTINSPLLLAAGFIFRPLEATLYTLIADIFGITFNFLVARYYGFRLLKQILRKQQVDRVKEVSKRINWELVFLFRLVPFIGSLGIDLVSYAAGLTRMRWRVFVLATLVPWAVIDVIHFYSLNYFVFSGNAIFLLPLYYLVTIPLGLLILRIRSEYRVYFRGFFSHLRCWWQQALSELTGKPALEKW